MATVVLIGTLDTKGPEYKYMRDCVLAAGADCLVVDISILREPHFVPDVSAAEVARAGGTVLGDLRFGREGSDTRAVALAAMERGAVEIVKRLYGEGRCQAVLGAGGSGGSTVISAVMRSLPLGVPKILVSTLASSSASGFFGISDICLMNAVVDIAGLNRFSKRILGNAAIAAASMASWPADSAGSGNRPLIAITMFGITTLGVLRLQERLHDANFATIVFHAVGSGGRAMEQMIEDGIIDGVIDYTISELTDELLGGIFPAGPHRLETAGRRGIPQLVVPGAIEVLNFGPRSTIPARYDVPERRLIVHNPHVCAVRTTKDEAAQLGHILSAKLNIARGPVALLIPLQGFDAYQQPPDGPFIDPEADAAFIRALREGLNPNIAVTELNLNINDPAFADAAYASFLGLWNALV